MNYCTFGKKKKLNLASSQDTSTILLLGHVGNWGSAPRDYYLAVSCNFLASPLVV